VRDYHPVLLIFGVIALLLGFAAFFISFVTAPFLIIGIYIAYALTRERIERRG